MLARALLEINIVFNYIDRYVSRPSRVLQFWHAFVRHKIQCPHNNPQRMFPKWYNNQNGWEEGRGIVENLVGGGGYICILRSICCGEGTAGIHLPILVSYLPTTYYNQHRITHLLGRYIIEGNETIKTELGLIQLNKQSQVEHHDSISVPFQTWGYCM